jgi:hypothetical protein
MRASAKNARGCQRYFAPDELHPRAQIKDYMPSDDGGANRMSRMPLLVRQQSSAGDGCEVPAFEQNLKQRF